MPSSDDRTSSFLDELAAAIGMSAEIAKGSSSSSSSAEADSAKDSLPSLHLTEAEAAVAEGAPTQVNGLGVIERVVLSSDWLPGRESAAAGAYYRDFKLSSDPDVRISFSYAGRPLHPETAAHLKWFLQQPDAQIPASEIETLHQVWGNRWGRHFDIESVHSGDVNERRTLMMKGYYLESGLASYTVFAPADRDCFLLQEIEFSAPTTDFDVYMELAKDVIASISWK